MPSLNRALSQADVIFLFGARLNWILHFGRPPRFQADVKIVQVCANQFSFIALLTFCIGKTVTCDLCFVPADMQVMLDAHLQFGRKMLPCS